MMRQKRNGTTRASRCGGLPARFDLRRGVVGAGLAVALIFGTLALPTAQEASSGEHQPSQAAAPPADDGDSIHFAPQARKLSIYEQMVRVQITNLDVSFEAPEAYRESFAFWTGRMKNVSKTELIEFMMTSMEPNPEGMIPFKRRAKRFMIEMMKDGRPSEPYGPLQRQVTTLVWEGLLDRFGNVVKLEKVAGEDNPAMEDLSFPLMNSVQPKVEPMILRKGEGFKDVAHLPLPSRIKIKGIENVGLVRTREYILDQVMNTRANFRIVTTFTNDPNAMPDAADTFCTISGGGEGTASFDLRRGVFISQRDVATLRIDIEAPLRPLPGKPETNEGGRATSRLDLEIRTTLRQKVRRVWGEDKD